jgi:hypothetical protein
VHVNTGGDDCLTAAQTRQPAAVLLVAADEVDGYYDG